MCVDVCWLIPAVRQLRPMAFRMSDEHLYNATQLCAKGVDECTRVCVCVCSLRCFVEVQSYARTRSSAAYHTLCGAECVCTAEAPFSQRSLLACAHTNTQHMSGIPNSRSHMLPSPSSSPFNITHTCEHTHKYAAGGKAAYRAPCDRVVSAYVCNCPMSNCSSDK